jgi:hypothetical protein
MRKKNSTKKIEQKYLKLSKGDLKKLQSTRDN